MPWWASLQAACGQCLVLEAGRGDGFVLSRLGTSSRSLDHGVGSGDLGISVTFDLHLCVSAVSSRPLWSGPSISLWRSSPVSKVSSPPWYSHVGGWDERGRRRRWWWGWGNKTSTRFWCRDAFLVLSVVEVFVVKVSIWMRYHQGIGERESYIPSVTKRTGTSKYFAIPVWIELHPWNIQDLCIIQWNNLCISFIFIPQMIII